MPYSTLRKSRGDNDAPPAMAPPEPVPQADSDDLITLVKLVLSHMDDDEAASFAARLATLLDDLRRTLQPTPDRTVTGKTSKARVGTRFAKRTCLSCWAPRSRTGRSTNPGQPSALAHFVKASSSPQLKD